MKFKWYAVKYQCKRASQFEGRVVTSIVEGVADGTTVLYTLVHIGHLLRKVCFCPSKLNPGHERVMKRLPSRSPTARNRTELDKSLRSMKLASASGAALFFQLPFRKSQLADCFAWPIQRSFYRILACHNLVGHHPVNKTLVAPFLVKIQFKDTSKEKMTLLVFYTLVRYHRHTDVCSILLTYVQNGTTYSIPRHTV